MPRRMRWDELVDRLPKDRPIVGAEIGVWEGKTSERLLRALPQLTLFLVDRWRPPSQGDSFYGSGSTIADESVSRHRAALTTTQSRIAPYNGRVRYLVGDSDKMANGVADGSLDFIFVDGDHSYEGVLRDLAAWVPKVKPGGVIGGHDIDRPEKGGVTEAVNEYFQGRDIERGGNFTWWTKA